MGKRDLPILNDKLVMGRFEGDAMMGSRLSKNGRIFILLSTIILILWGCAGPGKRLEPPRVSLANIGVKEIKAFESVFQIELRVFNTNDVAIEIKGIDCELELDDNHLARGVTKTSTKIPSYGTATIPVDVYSSVLDIVKSVLTLPNKEKLKYKIKGRVHLGGGLLVPSEIPFKSEGELSLQSIIEPK